MGERVAENRMVLASRFDEVRRVESEVLDAAESSGFDAASCFAIKLSLEEALANAIKHGNGEDPDKQVTVEYRVTPEAVRLTVCDEGGGFHPHAVPDPRLDENLEKPNGRGIMLMRCYMNEVSFNEAGNCVTMVKRRSTKAVRPER